MIRHVWSVLCGRTAVDRESNNISLFEVYEAVQFVLNTRVEYPVNLPFEGTLASLWARRDQNTPITGQMRMRILSGGEELGTSTHLIDLQNHSRSRTMIRLNGMRVAGDGVHEFEMSWRENEGSDWQVVATVPLDVRVTIEEEPQAAR